MNKKDYGVIIYRSYPNLGIEILPDNSKYRKATLS